MIIPAKNNLTINAPFTYLTQAANAGTSVLNVKNITPFNASWAVQLGATSESQSEIVLLTSSAPSGTLGSLTANTLYDHPQDTPIYGIKFDQIVFERSTTGTTGVAAPITNGTVGIMCTGSTTFFDDTTGASTYGYKTYFRSSVLALNSTESDWITSSGFAFFSLGKIRQRVKDKLVSAGYISGINVDDGMITDWLNEYKEMLDNAAADVNEDYTLGTLEVDYTGTQELGTITATDFRGQFTRIFYADGSGTFLAQKMDMNSYSPNKTWTNTFPYFYMQGDNIIGRKPSDSTGTLICTYPKLNTLLVEDTDLIPVIQQSYTNGYVNYAMSQALFKDQKIQEAGVKEGSALALVERFKKEMTPRNKTGMSMISIVEDTAADSELFL